MYEVKIYNNGVETLIHYPTADKEAPHLLNLPFKESLSLPDELSFSIPYVNPGYNLIYGIKTKVKVYDTRDNSVVFSGRVMPMQDGMNSEGKFDKGITCEGALAYLNDSHTRRWNFKNKTPTEIITYLLNQHNSKVDVSRQIQIGIVDVTQAITIDTNFETTLNTIISKIRNILGGDISVREDNGVLYLDYLKAQGANNEVVISLGYNLKEIIREYDPTDIVTRVIPLGYGEGINQLDIKKVNNNVEYVEDTAAIAEYGVIEGVATNKDLQNADTLKIYGETVLKEKKQPKFTYQQTALDLSVLTGHENEKYEKGDTLHTIVDVLGIDVYSRVIERERDLLLDPWNPRLTISTRPIRLTDQIIDLKQRNMTLENAPQGSTCIFPLTKAENADATHPVEFDLDIPEEAININKVYINIHGRKFRADSKATFGGGEVTNTSTTEGGGTVTSGASSQTTTGGGGHVDYMQNSTLETHFVLDDVFTEDVIPIQYESDGKTHKHMIETYYFNHGHYLNLDIPDHTHDINHTHDIDMNHTHDIDLPDHTHDIDYGIYEGTYPKNVKIKVNNEDIGVNYGDGNNAFDEYNIDITSKVNIGNNKIQITTEQNGRIDAVVYSQIFIQSK